MSEYIKREDVYKVTKLCVYVDSTDASTVEIDMDALDAIPAADVAEVVHAKWVQEDYFDEDNGVYTCSNCKEAFTLMEGSPEQNLYNHCPKCGARMDGDAHD